MTTLTQQAYIDSRGSFEKFADTTHLGFTDCGGQGERERVKSHIKDTLISITEARIKDREGSRKELLQPLRDNADTFEVQIFFEIRVRNEALELENKADRDFINWVKEQ